MLTILIIVLSAATASMISWDRARTLVPPETIETNDTELNLLDMAVTAGIDIPTIDALRKGNFAGSPLVIEETLTPGSNYRRYIASYQSEGLKIYGLLTIPNGVKPATGWPLIIFNHGYIPPDQYRTTERYLAYTDGFSKSGYILFRPDYRGHGNSQGVAVGGYGSNAYTIDVLNALAALKLHPDVDKNRIGMWGHSMGGFITLRSMVVNDTIKAGVIWGGVVASYSDLLTSWRRGTPSSSPTPFPISTGARRWRQVFLEQFGSPESNPTFWDSISANSYLHDLSGPIQLHHGTADTSVPVEFSETLNQQISAVGKQSELYTYPNDDHNISKNFSLAMRRSIEFFDTYVKQTETVQ